METAKPPVLDGWRSCEAFLGWHSHCFTQREAGGGMWPKWAQFPRSDGRACSIRPIAVDPSRDQGLRNRCLTLE